MAVLDPVRLKLVNWAEVFGSDGAPRAVPRAGASAAPGARRRASFALGPELWIERDDFAEMPPKGFFRLFPGNRVRLKYGYVVECTRLREGRRRPRHRRARHASCPTRRAARRAPTRSRSRARSPGSASTTRCRPRCASTTACSPRRSPTPAAATSWRASTRDSKTVVAAYVEPLLARRCTADRTRSQFERHGYFVADLVDHRRPAPARCSNRIGPPRLKDSRGPLRSCPHGASDRVRSRHSATMRRSGAIRQRRR